MSEQKTLDQIQVGDVVVRTVGDSLPMEIKVTGGTKDRIYCGPWEFSRKNGAEIDDELGWDEFETGSYIRPP
jgi:hypothetical protein